MDANQYDLEIGKYIFENKLYPEINVKTMLGQETPLMLVGKEFRDQSKDPSNCFYLMCEMEGKNLEISGQALAYHLMSERIIHVNSMYLT